MREGRGTVCQLLSRLEGCSALRILQRTARAWMALPLLILLLLTACSNGTESEPKGPSFAGTITLWASRDLAGHPGLLEEGWLEERARAYEAAHQGVTVQIRLFATGEELERALLTGSERPDLAFGRHLPSLGDKLATLPLPADLIADHYTGAQAAFRHGDGLAGLPVLLDLQVLALNEQRFAARGVALPAEGRWTHAEFADRLLKLSGNDLFALGFSHAPGYHQWWPLLNGLFDQGGAVVPQAEAGLEQLARWRKEGILTPGIATLTTEESYRLFAAGQIAVLPVPVWALPLLRAEPFKASFTVASFPGDANCGYAYGFTALQGGQEPAKLQAMADLVLSMAAPDQQVRLARQTGLMPARKAAPNPFEGDPQLMQAFRLAESFRPLPAGPAWEAAQPQIAEELLLALYGGKAPAEALSAVKTDLHRATTPAKQAGD